MGLNTHTGSSAPEHRFADELEYLYKRLATVNSLISAIEEYDLRRPKPVELPTRERTA